MQSVAIHKAGADDAATLAALAHELAAYEGETTQADEAALRRALAGEAAPRCEALLARESGGHEAAAAGFALYYPGYDLASAGYGFHLADLYVREPWRRRGIGQALVVAMAQQALEEGRAWVSLTALRTNRSAQAFYAGLGFSEADLAFLALGPRGMGALTQRHLKPGVQIC